MRTSRLPGYGIAASFSSLTMRIPGTLLPSISTGLPAFAGQLRHGALTQALAQVVNGARRYVVQLSNFQRFQFCGHWTSVHCTAAYPA